jgi:predicted DNA-binding protein YlxM (UPF0122 family)
MVEKTKSIVLSLFNKLDLEIPEKLRNDNQFLKIAKWHADSLKRFTKKRSSSDSYFEKIAERRFGALIKDYLLYTRVTNLAEKNVPIPVIARKNNLDETTISRWIKMGYMPKTMSLKNISSREKMRRELSKQRVLRVIKDYTLEIYGDDPEQLQEITSAHGILYEGSYHGVYMPDALRINNLTWYEALTKKFSDIPIKNGKRPLRIKKFGNRALSKWMFDSSIFGKWDDILNRIGFTQYLYASSKWSGMYLRNRRADMLKKIKERYGTASPHAAMVEASIITPGNYKKVKSRIPKFCLSKEKVDEIWEKSGEELHSKKQSHFKIRRSEMKFLYSMGYSYPEIGKMYFVDRREVFDIIKPVEESERQMHEMNRLDRIREQKLDELFKKFEERGINRKKVEKTVNKYLNFTNIKGISEILKSPKELVRKYFKLKDLEPLSYKQTYLNQLALMYLNGFDISPINMRKYNSETCTLYERLRDNFGGYINAIKELGLDTNKIYRKFGSGIRKD